MLRWIAAPLIVAAFLWGSPAYAAPLHAPCIEASQAASECDPVNQANPLPVAANSYPVGATAITGNAAGTIGAVVGTLPAAAAKTTYVCGFDVSYIGGTAAVSPITVAGLVGSSMVYQLPVSATGGQTFSRSFNPCIPASAVNTAITVTTTADGTATAVDVNSWGFQQ